ncbi:MAG: hypothetical protein ACI9W6_002647 [Motiliproteus sp.]
MSQKNGLERRRVTRIAFDAEAELRFGECRWVVQIRDISFKGVLLSHPPGFDGKRGDLLILETWLDSDVQLLLSLTLSRVNTDYLGCSCGAIDLSSMTHLRRLVELNIGDASLLDRELESLSEASE